MSNHSSFGPDTRWLEVIAHHPETWAESVSFFLFENGATAVEQEPDTPGRCRTRSAFRGLESAVRLESTFKAFLDELSDIFGEIGKFSVQFQEAAPGDWSEKWKEGLAPIAVRDRLVVTPTWCEVPDREGQVVIRIDPGQAFGTGHHETTRMCLELLCDLDGRPRGPVFDLGAGTGILALSAAAMGWGPVTAVDNDPDVLPVMAENIAANGFADHIRIACSGPEAVAGPFALILANLTAGDLVPLAPDFDRLAAPDGYLILSGLLIEQEPAVLATFEQAGFRLDRGVRSAEWSALGMARAEHAPVSR